MPRGFGRGFEGIETDMDGVDEDKKREEQAYQAYINNLINNAEVGFGDAENRDPQDERENDGFLEEYYEQNQKVFEEFEQYYDDSITYLELQKYLKNTLDGIYGKEMNAMASVIGSTLTIDEFLNGFFQNIEEDPSIGFSGVDDYKQLIQNLEDYLKIMRKTEAYQQSVKPLLEKENEPVNDMNNEEKTETADPKSRETGYRLARAEEKTQPADPKSKETGYRLARAEVKTEPANPKSIETGYRLARAEGMIWDSAVEATGDVRTFEVKESSSHIIEVQKEKVQGVPFNKYAPKDKSTTEIGDN